MQDVNLRYLHEAARLGSMRAAADLLEVAVSSVSRQISQLEAELGIALIEHGRRAVMLTEAGRLLVEYYAQQQLLREGFASRLSDLKGLRAGRVVLAIGEGFVGPSLSGLLARFIAKHQAIAVDIHMSASSSEIVRMVVEDVAHLGLAFQSSEDPRVRVLASARHPLCAIVRPSHVLAAKTTVALSELCAHPMCLPEGSFRTRQLLNAAESAEKLSLQPVITSNSIVMLKSLLLSSQLLTVLPKLAVAGEIERGELVAVPIQSDALQNTSVHLIGRLGRQLTPAPLRLMSTLLAYLNRYEQSGGAAPPVAADANNRGGDVIE